MAPKYLILLLMTIPFKLVADETVKGTITGDIINSSDDSLVCALILINGEYKTFSCTSDGTNQGAPFTLEYDYYTDSLDTSANQLLVFASGYKNETFQVTQPDEQVTIKMERNDDSLVGFWMPWFVNENNELEASWDANRDGPINISSDDGDVVTGDWRIYLSRGLNQWYSLNATYIDNNFLAYEVDMRRDTFSGQSQYVCSYSGKMQRSLNMIVVTKEFNSCSSTTYPDEYWIRYSR